MSRSQERLQNPCRRWFKWEGGKKKGYLTWYEKETETNHVVEKPFTFLVLDQLNTVTGYDKDAKVGFYANEVRTLSEEILTVKSKGGVEASGLWSQIKGQNKSFDFTKSVYIAFFDENKQLQIGNIKFKGSGLSGLTDDAIAENLQEAKIKAGIEAKEKGVDVKTIALDCYTPAYLKQIGWINFSNSRKDIEQIAVVWTDVIADKNGDTDFFRPVFTAKTNISDETNRQAVELDKELQAYLKAYFASTRQEAAQTDSGDHLTGQDYINARNAEIDSFEEEKSAADNSANNLVGENDYSTLSDDDIPF